MPHDRRATPRFYLLICTLLACVCVLLLSITLFVKGSAPASSPGAALHTDAARTCAVLSQPACADAPARSTAFST